MAQQYFPRDESYGTCAAKIVGAQAFSTLALALYIARRNTAYLRAQNIVKWTCCLGFGFHFVQSAALCMFLCDIDMVVVLEFVFAAFGCCIAWIGAAGLYASIFLRYYRLEVAKQIAWKEMTMDSAVARSTLELSGDSERQVQHQPIPPSVIRLARVFTNSRVIKPTIWCYVIANVFLAVLFAGLGRDGLRSTYSVPELLSTRIFWLYTFASSLLNLAPLVPILAASRATNIFLKVYGEDSIGLKVGQRHMFRIIWVSQLLFVVPVVGSIFMGWNPRWIFLLAAMLCEAIICAITVVPLIAAYRLCKIKRATSPTPPALLAAFLKDPKNRQKFRRHLETEFAGEMLLFYEKAIQFKRLAERGGAFHAKAESLLEEIKHNFLRPGAELEINLPFHVLSMVQGTHNAARVAPTDQCASTPKDFATSLDVAIDEILDVLSGDPLMRFKIEPDGAALWATFENQQKLVEDLEVAVEVAAAISSTSHFEPPSSVLAESVTAVEHALPATESAPAADVKDYPVSL